MLEELHKIYKYKETYLENTKITRLDYLNTVLFVLTNGFFSDKMIYNFEKFLK